MNKLTNRLSKFGRQNLLFCLFFVLVVSLLHHRSWNQPPIGNHVWAQSDHYALALGFLDNNFDFFHPKTYTLSHQFPPKKLIDNPQGITAVDFPILHYTVAGIMQLLGSDAPWIFRTVNLLLSLLAMFCLFSVVNRHVGIWQGFFLVSIIIFQPYYIYYQNGFHVSSAALNVLIIGYSHLLSYFKTSSKRSLYFGLFFLMLAALMRFTHLISLIALLGGFALLFLKERKYFKESIITLGFMLPVLAYFIYNQYLATHYGSVFLNHPILPENLEQLLLHAQNGIILYAKGFLPPLHLLALGALLFTAWKHRSQLKHVNILQYIFITLLLLGSLLYSALMSYHISTHDYYSLDVWLPTLLWLLLTLLCALKISKNTLQSYRLPLLGLMTSMLLFAVFYQERRYGTLFKPTAADYVVDDYLQSRDFLNTHISANDKVLVIGGDGWNTPLVAWRRPAFRLANNYKQQLPLQLSIPYDYIVMRDSIVDEVVLKNYPQFQEELKLEASNGKVSIWKHKP
ncbi:MAG: glycosyltransferase family 39 protein [Weeksellaceae bacterium]|nr:glycosyltransferase family 39 protein [Weeksellaceae bacterium]